MDKLILNYLGEDYLGLPVYDDEDGELLKDINGGMGELNLHTICGDVDGDPNQSISKIKKYQGLEIIVLGRNNDTTEEEKSNYALLSRLQSDCEYFLGFGCRGTNSLWAKDVESQIAKMKELHDSFPSTKKPQWLTYDEILRYEKLMTA